MNTRTIIDESLKLMHVTYDQDLSQANIDDLIHDDNYGGYFAGMYGAINRCLSELENKRVLPSKRHVIKPSDTLASPQNLRVRYDTSAIADFLEVERIVTESKSMYMENTPYSFEGDILVLPYMSKDQEYILLYKPRIERVTIDNYLDKELDIPNEIAEYIPYFIKGDLFREDDLAEANQSMNFFEQAMDEYISKRYSRQLKVRATYDLTRM